MTQLHAELLILLSSSALIYVAFIESISIPSILKNVWTILFPTYLIVMMSCIVSLLVPDTIIFVLTGISFAVFIYSSILFAITLSLKKKHRTALLVKTI